MKKITLLTATIVLMIAGCTNSSTNTEGKSTAQTMTVDTTKMKTGDIYYQCEMHPEVLSDKAGTCTKCDMELVKMVKK
jgi:hypothetical protein